MHAAVSFSQKMNCKFENRETIKKLIEQDAARIIFKPLSAI